MRPRFRVSSERLEKPGIEPTTPVLEGEQLYHYATEASKIRLPLKESTLLLFIMCLFLASLNSKSTLFKFRDDYKIVWCPKS